MNIKKHRFMPVVSMSSKIFVDKKRKNKSRQKLNLETKKQT